MGIYGWMFQSEERISAKVQSWSVEGPGDQTNAMGVGVAVDRGPCRLLEGLPLGRNSVGQWQSFYGLWLLRCVKKARIHPLKAATLPVPCTPLPSSTAKLGSSGTAFAVFLHSLRTLLRVPSSAFLASPAGSPVVFPTLNSTLTHVFCFLFF